MHLLRGVNATLTETTGCQKVTKHEDFVLQSVRFALKTAVLHRPLCTVNRHKRYRCLRSCAASSKPMYDLGIRSPRSAIASHGVTEIQPLRGSSTPPHFMPQKHGFPQDNSGLVYPHCRTLCHKSTGQGKITAVSLTHTAALYATKARDRAR